MSCHSDLVRIKSKDLRIKRIELMSTDTGYHSHSGVQDPKAPQVASLYPQKPSPSKNKPEPSNISLQASCHTFTVILRPFPIKCFPCGSACKESACSVGNLGLIRGQEDPLQKGMATHSSILAWRIPGTKEPSGLQSMGSQRVRHD